LPGGLADACAGAITDRDAVEAAFHDAIYDTRRDDNEERSAALAMARLRRDYRRPHRAHRRHDPATAGHVMPDFTDAAARRDCTLFLDMDLAILGSPPADFRRLRSGGAGANMVG
jgi:predicted metal-dependent HD superfamily phosphohydrolase